MRARKAERNEEIMAALKAGLMQKDIAKIYGLSTGRVSKIIANEKRLLEEQRKKEIDEKALEAAKMLVAYCEERVCEKCVFCFGPSMWESCGFMTNPQGWRIPKGGKAE